MFSTEISSGIPLFAITSQSIVAPLLTFLLSGGANIALDAAAKTLFGHPIPWNPVLEIGPGIVAAAFLGYASTKVFPKSARAARRAWGAITVFWALSIAFSLRHGGLAYTLSDFFNPPPSDIGPGLLLTDAAACTVAYSLVAEYRWRRANRERRANSASAS
jgi:hypothetical protein